MSSQPGDQIPETEEDWRIYLTPERFHVLREGGTEAAYSGEYNDFHEEGYFRCAGCGNPLFASSDKFNSGTGWPSFTKSMTKDEIEVTEDHKRNMHRNEVKCSRCHSHLGHVFPDGPSPTGMRYCINSRALKFNKV